MVEKAVFKFQAVIHNIFFVSNLQYIRCAKSDYGCYNVTEPPIDAPRDPLYKSEREISKVRLKY